MRASKKAKEFVQWASELQREERPLKDLWVSHQVRRVGHHLGLRRQPDRRQRLRQALPARRHAGASARPPSSPAASTWSRRAAAPTRCARSSSAVVRPLPGGGRAPQDERPARTRSPPRATSRGGLTTIEEKALGNIQKIGRKCLVDGVLDKAEDADRAGPVVHGLVLGRRRDGHAVRGGGLRRALLPDRARATSSATRSCR